MSNIEELQGSYLEVVANYLRKPLQTDPEFKNADLYINNPDVSIKHILQTSWKKPVDKLEHIGDDEIRKAFAIPIPEPVATAHQPAGNQGQRLPLTSPINVRENQGSNHVNPLETPTNQTTIVRQDRLGSFSSDINEFERYERERFDMDTPTHRGFGHSGQGQDLVVLQQHLLSAIEAIIQMKWSKSLQQYANNYLAMGLPNGNPFTIVITPESGMIPMKYFEEIKNPMDLATIKNRVKDYFYDDFHSFESDVKLVISNALSFHKATKDHMRRMAKAVSKRADEVLEKMKRDLNL